MKISDTYWILGAHSGHYEDFWDVMPCSMVEDHTDVSEERTASVFRV
jgi:hypothetical protein